MLKTLQAKVHQGKIELLEPADLPEGAELLVTVLSSDNLSSDNGEASFWAQVSQPSLSEVWDNTEDDVYAKLLKE